MMPYIELRDLRVKLSEVAALDEEYQKLRSAGGPEALKAMDDLHRKVVEAYDLEDRVFQQIVSVLEQGF